MTTTFERLVAMLVKDYNVSPDQIAPDATMESLGIDSLGVAELLFTVEDEFKIELPNTPVTLATVGEVARFIDRLVAAQATPPNATASERPTKPPPTPAAHTATTVDAALPTS